MAAMKSDAHCDGITLGGAQIEADATLLRQYFGPGAPGASRSGVGPRVATQLEINKLGILPFSAPAETDGPGMEPALERCQARQRRWQETLALATSLFDPLDVSYLLMKALRSPFALMSDVDFLVPSPRDLARMTLALEDAGFALYRFRLLSHPLKIMAEEAQPGETPLANIDLYPDAMWIRKHVLDGSAAVRRRRSGTVRGIAVWEPCPEDDFYLVATHAFAHGEIHLAELDHGARILASEPFSWEYLLNTAAGFGCQDAVYLYLRLLAAVHEAMGVASPVPSDVRAALDRQPACRGVRRWLDNLELVTFPLRIPVWFCTLSSARYHLPAASRRLRWTETAFDAATHILTAGSHVLRRD